jgi:hypothetical protein
MNVTVVTLVLPSYFISQFYYYFMNVTVVTLVLPSTITTKVYLKLAKVFYTIYCSKNIYIL